MRERTDSNRFTWTVEALKRLRIPSKVIFILLGVVSTVWFLIRVIPKPSRATYPCMRAATPWASAFVVYLLSMAAAVFSIRKFQFHLKAKHIPLAVLSLIAAMAFSTMSLMKSDFTSVAAGPALEGANLPMGEAKGIFPGRVVWAYNPDATNASCTNNFGDGYYMDANTDQDVVDDMLDDVVMRLTGESTLAASWDAIFRSHNQERGKGDVGYAAGEIIFLKVNRTSSWGGNYSTTDLSRIDNGNYAISETSPHVVTAVLRHLVNEVGVAQSDIYIGDPMKHLYKSDYDKWHAEFPDVHYLDVSYSSLGREQVTASGTAVIDYSDRGTVLREGDWSSALTGDPIQTDNLYSIFEEMEYMINIPTMKGHIHAGVTMFAKNHFGSQTRSDAKHLHGGLVSMGDDPLRNDYGMYRVQVDLLGHELLGKKNLIYIMDALYSSEMEIAKPRKFHQPPWNEDWSSSILISQDPVAIESVGFDILYYEFDGSNGVDDFPHYGAVDDYLHQAADSANWPEGIEYDPENDGSIISSLGVHEHWNNASDMLYSRNLGSDEGIELIKLWPKTYGSAITAENSELPSNQVNTVLVDSAMTIWIGTDAGLSRLTDAGWKHYDTILLNVNVNDIEYERTNYGREIWIATDGGLSVAGYSDIDGVTSATTYTPENSNMLGRKVSSVAVDPSHNRWVATDSAINVYRGSSWNYVSSTADAMGDSYNFADYKLTEVGIIEEDTMALFGTLGKGIARMSYDPVDGFTGASTYGSPWSAIDSDSITAVEVDGITQWYGTKVGAYFHPDTDAKSQWILHNTEGGLADNRINTILTDRSGNVWFGTPSGISILLPDGGMMSYTTTEGLLSNEVNCLVDDIEGNIWAATSGGLQWFEGLVGEQVALGVPALLTPATGVTEQELELTLTWSAITGATGYDLQVSTDPAFASDILVDRTETGTSAVVNGLNLLTTYYWRVAATDGTITSNWTAPYSFTTYDEWSVPGFNGSNPIEVYPVPVGNNLTIKCIDESISGVISIYSMQGRLILQQELTGEITNINTSDMTRGTYILRYQNGKYEYSTKLVK
ncbi:MAG: DUF362 domain-containing protein [Bacteroidales bacterium]|nr:DUF362 domain-containing protein [Bacteroidales bacterium]